jgi:hypothetical protein
MPSITEIAVREFPDEMSLEVVAVGEGGASL